MSSVTDAIHTDKDMVVNGCTVVCLPAIIVHCSTFMAIFYYRCRILPSYYIQLKLISVCFKNAAMFTFFDYGLLSILHLK